MLTEASIVFAFTMAHFVYDQNVDHSFTRRSISHVAQLDPREPGLSGAL